MSLTPEQQLLRRTGVSASEIAALANLSRFATPVSIFENKTLPPKDEDDVSIPLELGNALEEPIAKLWRRETGMATAPCATMRHPDKKFALCTPDRGGFRGEAPIGEVVDQGGQPLLSLAQLQKADVLVQCKSTSWRMKSEWGEPGTDAIPEEYLCQETWEMGITGHRSADVAVLFDKDRYATYRVQFSQTLFDGLYELAERFMIDHVLANAPPPPDTSERYSEFLRRAYPTHKTDSMLVAPQELTETIIRFGVLRNAEKLIKDAVKLYGSRIKLAIGENSGMTGPFGRLTWKKNKDTKGVDWKAATAKARDIAGVMLKEFGPSMPAEQREVLTRSLASLEADCTVVTRVGARPLKPTWTSGFKADLAGETMLDLSATAQELEALPPGDDEFDPVTGEVIE